MWKVIGRNKLIFIGYPLFWLCLACIDSYYEQRELLPLAIVGSLGFFVMMYLAWSIERSRRAEEQIRNEMERYWTTLE